jgi:hypothetical protein
MALFKMLLPPLLRTTVCNLPLASNKVDRSKSSIVDAPEGPERPGPRAEKVSSKLSCIDEMEVVFVSARPNAPPDGASNDDVNLFEKAVEGRPLPPSPPAMNESPKEVALPLGDVNDDMDAVGLETDLTPPDMDP